MVAVGVLPFSVVAEVDPESLRSIMAEITPSSTPAFFSWIRLAAETSKAGRDDAIFFRMISAESPDLLMLMTVALSIASCWAKTATGEKITSENKTKRYICLLFVLAHRFDLHRRPRLECRHKDFPNS